MHDLKWLEAHSEEASILLKKRGEVPDLGRILDLIKERRILIGLSEDLKRKRNDINDELKKADKSQIEKRRDDMRELGQKVKEADQKLAQVEEALQSLALLLPNIPHPDVPEGASEKDNLVIKEVLAKPVFNFKPRDHVELGQMTDTIDLVRAAKVSGSRFVFLKGIAARLNRALMQFFCDFHNEKGDIELAPPYMVREAAMLGTGQFPKFVDDAFRVQNEGQDPYFLIPTAEVPVTNYFADEIINEEDLPLRFCAYSACFRAEAGAAGRDTRGMIRVHQFEKVEMVRFVKAADAMKELNLMVERASELLSLLKLPHRIVALCGGDLGFHSEKTYDLEVYLPGQDAFREISSCSSFASFQARRAKIRMRKADGKIEHLATLNGSGLPLGRTLVAIYENYQEADASIRIPDVLQKYMHGLKKIELKR